MTYNQVSNLRKATLELIAQDAALLVIAVKYINLATALRMKMTFNVQK